MDKNKYPQRKKFYFVNWHSGVFLIVPKGLDLKCGILNTYLYMYFLFQRLHTFYTAMGWKPTRPNCIFNFGCTIHFGILAYCLGIYCHKCCYRLPLWITNGNTGYIHFCNFRHYFCTLYDQNIPCKTCWKVGWFYTLFKDLLSFIYPFHS